VLRRVPVVIVAVWLLPIESLARQGSGYQVTGRVVMADGSPLPSAAAVELLCNGRIRKRVTPYTSGDYTMILDEDNAQAQDIATPRDMAGGGTVPFTGLAQQPGGGEDVGRFDLGSCELRAAFPGHHSNQVALGPRRRLDKPVVATLVLRRTTDDGPVFTANTMAAPAQARSALDEAWKQLQKPKPDYRRAVRELQGAIKVYPTFAAAWHLLGVARVALKDDAGARQAFNESIAADPAYVEPYLDLATMEARLERWQECATLVSRVQQLNPYIPYANYLSASAHFQIGGLEVAEKSALAVLDTPELEHFPFTYYILGAIQARRGDFATASSRLRQYLLTKPDAATAASVEAILADWEREGRVKRPQ
jgi:tetratricopeptide (TPR) repeat protein